MKNILLITLLALSGAWTNAAADTASSKLKEQAVALDARFFAAVFTAPDRATVESMLTEDFEFTGNGKTKSRKHFITNLEGMWQQMAGGMTMKRELVEGSSTVSSDGEDRLTHTGIQRIYVIADGHEQLVEESEFRRELVRQNGRWMIASEITGPVPQASAAQNTAQETSFTSLEKVLAEKDTALFNAVFRTHNADALRDLLADDFEFYHDQNGLVSEDADSFVASVLRNADGNMRREVVEQSVQIFPLDNFGAIQQGVHRFYIVRGDAEPQLVETARFFHVWQKQEDGWKLKREFSYDHSGG